MMSTQLRSLAAFAMAMAICGSAFAGWEEPTTRGPKAFRDPRPRFIPPVFPAGGAGELTHTFPSFNQVVFNEPGGGLDPESLTLPAAPAGIYTGYTVTVDWSAISGDPWSNEAIWAFADNDFNAPPAVFYADPGSALNSAPNGSPVQLSWSGFMDTPYDTASGALWFLMAQTFDGSDANWNNISITINDSAPVAPPHTPTTLGGSLDSPLNPAEVLWYGFDYSGSGAFTIDTIGSSLSGGAFPNDTMIGLYSSGGALIDFNDDIDFGGGNYFSSLSFADGELPAGRYYLAAGGFLMSFGPAFGVSSTSAHSGTIHINGLTVIPEPTALAPLALALLGLARLRRR